VFAAMEKAVILNEETRNVYKILIEDPFGNVRFHAQKRRVKVKVYLNLAGC
jgi:hypothetical protein